MGQPMEKMNERAKQMLLQAKEEENMFEGKYSLNSLSYYQMKRLFSSETVCLFAMRIRFYVIA